MKYGVKLVSYDGNPMDMWVYEKGRFETEDEILAIRVRDEYWNKNPKGFYQVEKIN